ncbi:MAG TPA: hypothetical protein VHY22_00360, partial [Chthoniobacteraceae bacterium]|nr:hypothetical protein [Chthoniobacteraceae bacterium]
MALIIVLAFVVLLTGLVVAFFSRAIVDRQISNSSVYHANVDSFAHGAADAIIGNLEQEIVLGSSGTTYTVGSSTAIAGTLYTPLPGAAAPQISGTTSAFPTLAPNLLKLSRRNTLFYSGAQATIPAGGSNVVAVSSTTPSLNGRFISPARWNAHYLLPLANATDATPVVSSTTFNPPDWILVARDGSNPVPATVTGSLTVSATGASMVIGRYAYAIYNEGGLLDANVAGYPDSPATSGTMADYDASYKSATALADLTQIGLSQPQINELVAWRNAVTAGFPGQSYLSPGSVPGTNYFNNVVLSNTNGFLATSGTIANGQTDRFFSSRQELIKFMESGLGLSGASLGVLQYLGTFSRSLDQPSYFPVPSRPVVQGTGGYDSTNGYLGGNTGGGLDNLINPAFRTIRVGAPFTRNDGTTAVVGEPLVKRRFALNRLAWLTYKGPSQTLSTGDKEIQQYLTDGLTPQLLAEGGTANISNYFGLSWTPGPGTGGLGGYWTYTGHDNQPNTIQTLSAVASHNREPDFFELLKAAYCVGGEANYVGGVYDTINPPEEARDVRVDNYIIALGANIIDQFKPDSYPTAITFDANPAASPPVVYTFWGANDLPYLMGLTYMNVLVSPAQAAPPATLTSNNVIPQVALSSSGQVVSIAFPIVYNPHAINTANPVPTALAPTNLRICMAPECAAYPASGASS